MERLAGRVAVVTGAASGIGLALAERFAAEGMRLVLADVEALPLEAAARRLRDQGVEVLAVPTDVSLADSVEHLAQETLGCFGAVHVVCNNAGVMAFGHLTWQAPLAVWEWMLGVNLWGVVHGIRAFLPHMLERDEGHVVNTASALGLATLPLLAPYCASKHAVVALSEALHRELGMRGSVVRVSVLCPGLTVTRICEADRNWPARLGPYPDDPLPPEAREAVRAQHAVGTPPAEVARLVVEAIRDGRFWVLQPESGAGRLPVGPVRDQ